MIDIQNLQTLPGLLPAVASAHGDRPALKMAGGDEAVSYQELKSLSAAIAAQLVSAGAQSGDRIILFSESRPEWMASMFALWGLGITVVPLPVDMPPENLAAVFQFTGATYVVSSERVSKVLPAGLPVLLLEKLREGSCEILPETQLDIALLGFTSGSTSTPRAVELSAENLLANLKSLLALRSTSPESNFLSILPPAHLFELMVGHLGPLSCGATVVYSATLLPNRIIETLKQEKISGVILVPALLRVVYKDLVSQLVEDELVPAVFLKQSGLENIEYLKNESDAEALAKFRQNVSERIGGYLERLVVGGSAYNPHWAAIAQALNIKLEIGYGLTEASPIVSLDDAADCPFGSVGKALPGIEIKISPQGEILVRGPNVMRGYFQDPEGTGEALVDGWLHTGDKGELDDDGCLFIRGRLKEAMVTDAGDTIYPEDVEPYYGCSLFKEYCVIPFADDNGNDKPVLCVVPQSEEACEDELEASFNQLRSHAPGKFRLSKMVHLNSGLPRTAAGKVRRRALAEALQAQEVGR